VLVAGRDDLGHDLSSLTEDIDGAFLSGDFQGRSTPRSPLVTSPPSS
jgi:hypothetical protein